MKLKSTELFSNLDSGDIKTCYILTGEEHFLKQKAIDRLTKKLVDESLKDFNYNVFYGDKTQAGKIIEIAATMPMMAQKRLLIVKNFDKISAAERKNIYLYVKNPSATCCIICDGEKISETEVKSILELDHICYVVFYNLFESEIPSFIAREAWARGKEISREASDLLATMLGTDLNLIDKELDKLSIYLDAKKNIEIDDVKALIPESRFFSVFNLTDLLGKKNLKLAFTALEYLLNSGVAPVMIHTMIFNHFRTLFHVSSLAARKADLKTISAKIQKAQYFVKINYLPQSKNFSFRGYKEIMKRLLDADRDIKTGKKDPRQVLEFLVIAICKMDQYA